MKILDCTLRDGGYYTRWHFDQDLVDFYATSMSKLPVDYLEIGYRSPPIDDSFGEYFNLPVKTIERIKNLRWKNRTIRIHQINNIDFTSIT